MADRKTLTEYVAKSDLPKQTKLWLQARVNRWKTDRQVPQYLFRLRNIIQEKPKIRNKKDFRAYQPKEVYVELKIYKDLGGDTRRNVWAFSHAFPDGQWVEEDDEQKFGFTGSGNLKNIIVPKWFMDKVKTETKTIYKKGREAHREFGLLTENLPQGTGKFIQGIQTFGDGSSFLEQLQDVCRQSDEIASIQLALTRSGDQSDCVIQIVSVRDVPAQNLRALPPHLRPLRAWGNVEPLLTHKFMSNNAYSPKFTLKGACIPNALLNTFSVKDEKRVSKPKTSAKGRPRAPALSYQFFWSILHFDKPYPGDANFPALTLEDLDKILKVIKRRARAYDIFEKEIWRSSNYDEVPKKFEVLCLLIKDEHAYVIQDSYTKGWAFRKEDERSNLTYSAKASYMLTEKPPRNFVGFADTLERVKELVTASVPSKNDVNILWTGGEDFNTVCPKLIRDWEYQPDIVEGTGGRISQLKLRFQGTNVLLHLVPFGVTVQTPEFVTAVRSDPNAQPEYVKTLVTLDELNTALLLQHNLRKCLTPELRTEYSPNFQETLLKLRCAPPRIAFQDFDPESKYDVIDFAKSYPSIVRDAKAFAKFSRFDRFVAYDGHTPRRNNLYVWHKRPNAPSNPAFQVQFKDERGLKYGQYLFKWLDFLDIECYAEPFKVVRNPFKLALKAIYDSELPSILKKRPSLLAIGEWGKWRTHFKKAYLSATKEDAVYNQERLGGIILPTPEDFYTLVTYEERVLKDGFLPLQQYIYDEQMYRLAKLIDEVGAGNTLAVNVDCVYLKPGTKVSYPKLDTNTYQNLGKVQVEEHPKSIRARILPSNRVPPVVNPERLYVPKCPEPVALEQIPEPDVIRRIGQERILGIFDDVLQSHRLVLVKSPMPGSGKTTLVLDYIKRMCQYQRCAVACPTNFQARHIDFGQTLYELTGKIATKEHLWGRRTARYDVVVLEEIGQWNNVHWVMFCDYAERNPHTKFIATGDTKQIVPIEHNWNGDKTHKLAYFDRLFNEVFPVHIELMEPKRFKPEHIPRIKEMYRDFWELKLSIAQLCAKYRNKGKAPENAVRVAYRLDVVDYVNEQVHGSKPEYFEGLTLVKVTCCKEDDKIKRGFEVKIARIHDGHIWFEDECERKTYRKGYTLNYVRDNFDYAYAYTGHKLQGRSFDIPVVIYDADFRYTDRNWLWVAFTRSRDPTQIYVLKSPTEYKLNTHFALKKMRQYARDDQAKGRECDLLDHGEAAALQKLTELLEEQNYRCYDPLAEGCDRVLTLGNSKKKHHSDLSFDRTNNDYGHLWFSCDNIKLCCEQCNIRRKDAPIVA